MPKNIVILCLPPMSPELNPVENLWHFMRNYSRSNRAFEAYGALFQAASIAYRSLAPDILRSVCRCVYLTRGS